MRKVISWGIKVGSKKKQGFKKLNKIQLGIFMEISLFIILNRLINLSIYYIFHKTNHKTNVFKMNKTTNDLN